LLLVGEHHNEKKSMTIKHQANALPCSKRKLASQDRRTASNEHGGSSKWAQCWNLGERVAALTAEQRKYFISRVLANWEALMGTKRNNQHQGDA
jgi:hypothetical protein